MFTKTAIIAILATAAAAAPTSSTWTWKVKNFTAVASAAVTRYGFNVTAPAGPDANEPGFDGIGCSGGATSGVYVPCAIVGDNVPATVASQLFGDIISVQYSFTLNGNRYTYTGNATFAAPGPGHFIGPIDFDIIPTQASVVG